MNITTQYIYIDSSNRQKFNNNIYEKIYDIEPNAIEFFHDSSKIKINMENNFLDGDLINLSGITSKMISRINSLSVKKNSHYLRINHPNHGISNYGKYENHEKFFKQLNYVDILPNIYDEHDLIPDREIYFILNNSPELTITLKVDNIENNFPNSIGNIYKNFLNGIHKIYLLYTYCDGNYQCDPDNYIIKLDNISSVNYNFFNIISNIILNYIYGIPLEILNNTEYFIVENSLSDSFYININRLPIIDNHTLFYPNIYNTTNNNNIKLKKIENHVSGYNNSNYYNYNIGQIINGVTKIKIKSCCFPNTNFLKNDILIQWYILESGEKIYEMIIRKGFYSIDKLISTINNGLNENSENNEYFNVKLTSDNLLNISCHTYRFYDFREFKIFSTKINTNLKIYPFTKLYYFTATINLDNSFYSEQLYSGTRNILNLDTETKILVNIDNMIDSINTKTQLVNYQYINYGTITIIGNDLNIGDIILTDKFDDTICVYIITKIINNNTFTVIRNNTIAMVYNNIYVNIEQNILDNIEYENLGNINISFHHPNHNFNVGDKLIVNFNDIKYDTIVEFSDGNNYNLSIFNNSLFELNNYNKFIQIEYPVKFKFIKNSFINKNPYPDYFYYNIKYDMSHILYQIHDEYNYFFVTCTELAQFNDISGINNVLGIIKTQVHDIGDNSKIFKLYDNHVDYQIVNENVLNNISNISIKICYPDGELVDFMNMDHTMILELLCETKNIEN